MLVRTSVLFTVTYKARDVWASDTDGPVHTYVAAKDGMHEIVRDRYGSDNFYPRVSADKVKRSAYPCP